MSRQNLFILTYIGRVGESEVNAPAALPDHPGIISILCRGAAQSSFDAPLSTGATVGVGVGEGMRGLSPFSLDSVRLCLWLSAAL